MLIAQAAHDHTCTKLSVDPRLNFLRECTQVTRNMRFELPGHRFPKNTTSGFSDKFMRTTSFQVSVQKEAFVYSNCVSKSSSCYLLILFFLLGLFGLHGNLILWRRLTFLTLGLISIASRLGRLCAPSFARCVDLLKELLRIPGWNLWSKPVGLRASGFKTFRVWMRVFSHYRHILYNFILHPSQIKDIDVMMTLLVGPDFHLGSHGFAAPKKDSAQSVPKF